MDLNAILAHLPSSRVEMCLLRGTGGVDVSLGMTAEQDSVTLAGD